jgi:hypothetical protein
MPPLIPSAIFFPVKELSKRASPDQFVYAKLKINVTLLKPERNGGLVQNCYTPARFSRMKIVITSISV